MKTKKMIKLLAIMALFSGCEPTQTLKTATPNQTVNCSSWSYKPASCYSTFQVTVKDDQSGGLCDVPGNWKATTDAVGNLLINVINGCRADFSISSSASPLPSPSPSTEPSSAPTSGVYVVSPANGKFAMTSIVSGQAPFILNVSAVAPHSDPCTFDQTRWEADGMHNLCSPNWQKWSIPSPVPTGSFMGGATNADSICFHNFLNGQPYDQATTLAINQIAQCVSSSANAAYGSDLFKQTFVWNFGDVGTAYNIVKGFNGAHVYYTPGTYTVTVNDQTLKVVVTANTRTPVLVNTQADMDALTSVNNLAKVSNRWIQLKRGMTYNLKSGIYLYPNDWLTAQPGTGALPILTSTSTTTFETFEQAGAFGNVLVELVDLEHPGGNATTNPQLSQIYGSAFNVAFKDIVFKGLHKAFDLSGTGILVQNVGSAVPWTDVQLNQNFAIFSVTGASFYGNNVYIAQSDANSEPSLRANGGQLISVIGNNFGGWAGKYDWVSDRGAQNYYFGSNVIRGSLVNTQSGVGQDPVPSALYMNGVFENNVFDNCPLALQQGSQNTRISGNTFILRDAASNSDPYYLMYPPEQGWLLGFSGASFGIQTSNTVVANNKFYSYMTHPSRGGEILWMGDQTNTTFTGNTFWSAAYAPFQIASSLPLPVFSGNSFYVKKLADVPINVSPGNTVKLNTAYTPVLPY